MTLVLASRSAARIAMLRSAGVEFSTEAADIDEAGITAQHLCDGGDPKDVAGLLAQAKAQAISRERPDPLVLGSDQTLTHRDRLLDKASTRDQARAVLCELRGETHHLRSAACLVRDGQVVWSAVREATLTMRPFSDGFLDGYLDNVGDAILGSVGCYHLEGLGAQLFERVEGDYFTVLGMPLLDLLGALRDQGILTR